MCFRGSLAQQKCTHTPTHTDFRHPVMYASEQGDRRTAAQWQCASFISHAGKRATPCTSSGKQNMVRSAACQLQGIQPKALTYTAQAAPFKGCQKAVPSANLVASNPVAANVTIPRAQCSPPRCAHASGLVRFKGKEVQKGSYALPCMFAFLPARSIIAVAEEAQPQA